MLVCGVLREAKGRAELAARSPVRFGVVTANGEVAIAQCAHSLASLFRFLTKKGAAAV